MIKAFFFDVDGTLIELATPLHETYAHAIIQHGGAAAHDDIKERVGRLWRESQPDYLRVASSGETTPGVEEAFWRRFAEAVITPWVGASERRACAERLYQYYAFGKSRRLKPGVVELLSVLQAKGVFVGAYTNNDHRTHQVLAELGLSHFFKVILTAGEVGLKKPEPKAFLKIANTLHPGFESYWYIGDSFNLDISSAESAGWRGILVGAEVISGVRCFKSLVELRASLNQLC